MWQKCHQISQCIAMIWEKWEDNKGYDRKFECRHNLIFSNFCYNSSDTGLVGQHDSDENSKKDRDLSFSGHRHNSQKKDDYSGKLTRNSELILPKGRIDVRDKNKEK